MGQMLQIFGDFQDDYPPSQEFLSLAFSPSSAPIRQRWRVNGLSADFVADYMTTFFPGEDGLSSPSQQDKVRDAVSFIANELLENAMKFSDETSSLPIQIQLHLHSDSLIFYVTNSIKPDDITRFQTLIQEIVSSDPDELYIQQLEANALDDNNAGSGLGLLIMLTNYAACLGWKFETVQAEPLITTVTTMVKMPV
ncbi:DUF6272 family protein [Thermoleptolyngbya sp.]|jgi:hypothetical protein